MIEYLHSEFVWMWLGIVMIVLEMFLAGGIGFLFAGLGALTTFLLLTFDVIEYSFNTNLAVFLSSSLVWGIVLWYPMKSMRKHEKPYQDLVGTSIVVDHDLSKGKVSNITWSGVKMRAALDGSESLDLIKKGSRVQVVHIKGNLLYLIKEE